MSHFSAIAARGQVIAEARMTETCTIGRVTGRELNDDDEYVDTTETVYTGKCRVKTERLPSQVDESGSPVEIRDYTISLPFATSTQVERGDVVTVTASGDTWLVDRPLTVLNISYGEQVTARRLTARDRS